MTYKQIADHYGLKHQLTKLCEESAELCMAADKYRSKQGTRDELIDELADVYNMINQVTYLIKGEKEVAERIVYKIDRQERRIQKATKFKKMVEHELQHQLAEIYINFDMEDEDDE